MQPKPTAVSSGIPTPLIPNGPSFRPCETCGTCVLYRVWKERGWVAIPPASPVTGVPHATVCQGGLRTAA